MTALITQGPNSPFCLFVVNFDCVVIPAQDVTSTIACVQDFERGPHLTRGSFFSASGISMLNVGIASAGDVCARAALDPWESVRVRSDTNILAI